MSRKSVHLFISVFILLYVCQGFHFYEALEVGSFSRFRMSKNFSVYVFGRACLRWLIERQLFFRMLMLLFVSVSMWELIRSLFGQQCLFRLDLFLPSRFLVALGDTLRVAKLSRLFFWPFFHQKSFSLEPCLSLFELNVAGCFLLSYPFSWIARFESTAFFRYSFSRHKTTLLLHWDKSLFSACVGFWGFCETWIQDRFKEGAVRIKVWPR